MTDIKYKISMDHVSYKYSPGTPYEVSALNDVCIDFEEGKMTGVIGHTGSGKSTLIQMMNGLLKPDSGRIILDGEDIWSKPKNISLVRFRVGMVMQYPEYQLFDETVRKDISFGPRNMGMSQSEIDARVESAAEIVGISKAILDKSPFDLSGGQKRRVAIAGIMAMEPEVLVLDEPAAGLDPEGREAIFSAIEAYRKRKNATVIIVSHSMEDMARYCEKIIVMNHANVLMQGDRSEVFSHSDMLYEAGLDIPQITRLALLLRERGIDIDTGIYTVDDATKAIESLFFKEGAADQ